MNSTLAVECNHVFGPVQAGRIPMAACVKCGVNCEVLPNPTGSLFNDLWEKVSGNDYRRVDREEEDSQ